ncbi:hypothetical protein ACFWWC_10925 [Streptomyces sp. NPDC058642]|uniref:hypothetical protein n=1 Tax=Streptomyces sp. NPDC058642 TaxID=3346572 RepID=UPI0036497337
MTQQDQFDVWYQAEEFPPEVRRTDRLTFSAAALAHALFVTGRAPEDRSKHGVTSVYEWIHRASLIPAYVRRAPNGSLVRSDLARELDQSEKVSLSYILGQAMTGIFSENVMTVRFLMHVDRYAARHGLVFIGNSRRRADFFGEKLQGGWVVAEAKGRSRAVDYKVRQAMKAQKRTVSLIAGVKPDIAYGCAAHFPMDESGSERLRVFAVDPIEDEPEAIELPVDRDKFIQAYYEPFLSALDLGRAGDAEDDFKVGTFDSLGVSVGVLRAVIERVEQSHQGRLAGLHSDVTEILESRIPSQDELPQGQFLDGTFISTRWHDALNQEDWSEYYSADDFPWWKR